MLSVGFHAALVWFWWGGTARPAALHTVLPAPLVGQQRLQIVLLPTQTPPQTPALPPSTLRTTPPTKQLSAPPLPAAPPRSVQKAKPTRQATSDLSAASALPTPSSSATEPPSLATGQSPDPSPDASQPAQAGSSTRLNLDLRSALQAVERQRRKSPLAAAVDAQNAQHSQNARSVTARAFSALDSTSSSVVSETILSNGTRLVRFSGGGCMRMPNPAARSLDDVAKPVMERC